MVAPLLRPALITSVSAVVLLIPLLRPRTAAIGWSEFVLVCGGYGLLYLALSVTFGTHQAERQRFLRALDRAWRRPGAAGSPRGRVR
jgi:hypothetical protein